MAITLESSTPQDAVMIDALVWASIKRGELDVSLYLSAIETQADTPIENALSGLLKVALCT